MVSLQYTSSEGKRGNHVNITKNCECGTSHISQHRTFTFWLFLKISEQSIVNYKNRKRHFEHVQLKS